MGQPPYPSMTESPSEMASSNTIIRPRPSFRTMVRRELGPGGVTTTIITRSGGSIGGNTGGVVGVDRHHLDDAAAAAIAVENEDRFFDLMMQSFLASGMVRRSPEGMNYDELLQAFGDGTENLAAEERTIRSLPTAIIKDPQKELPREDQRTCAICLEDICEGDTRKTLPCLHGFHEDCVDKWLRNNGVCPVCKYRLDE